MGKTVDQTTVSPITIYTDGGCEPNPGVGGWAAILLFKGHERELCGGCPDTTNNRMEITAAIRGLEALTRPCRVDLHSDSKYLIDGITSWIKNWKRNNWRRGNQPVLNVDLWQELDRLCKIHRVNWIWVKGHAGNHYNERCDQLAQLEIQKQRSLLTNTAS
ncbi:MAG: ribonuclease HI [Candidatus Hydrogenedentes bacterium]|jgi:ribonuclease HI|nr:ribonuclease HI [Candidatus Hydrogenedentota bacterium]